MKEAIQEKILGYLLQMDVDTEPAEEGVMVVRYGSTLVFISCFEVEGRGYVRLAASMLLGIRLKMELLSRLLKLNSRVLFGSFQLFDDETLSFAHTLPAENLAFETFKHALDYVGRVADDHDEALQAIVGGSRGEELLDTSI